MPLLFNKDEEYNMNQTVFADAPFCLFAVEIIKLLSFDY